MREAAVDEEAEVRVVTNVSEGRREEEAQAPKKEGGGKTEEDRGGRGGGRGHGGGAGVEEVEMEESKAGGGGNGVKEELPLSFDPDSEVYMANACCELLHYRVALYVVGVAEMVGIAGWAALNYFWYAEAGLGVVGAVSLGVQAFLAAVALVVIGLAFYGMASERPNFIWPHMIYQMVGIGLGIGLTIVAVVAMAAGTTVADAVFGTIFGKANLPRVEEALGPIWPFCLAVIFDFGAAIGIWFYILVRGAYDFLLDKLFFREYSKRKRPPTNPSSQPQPQTQMGLQETST